MKDTLKERFYKARQEYNINGRQSYDEVSESCGVGSSAIWKIENGETPNPRLQTLIKLSNHYCVSMDWLAGLSDEPRRDENAQMICKSTGLSYKSLEVLKHMKKHCPGAVAMLNLILEQSFEQVEDLSEDDAPEYVFSLLNTIDEYVNSDKKQGAIQFVTSDSFEGYDIPKLYREVKKSEVFAYLEEFRTGQIHRITKTVEPTPEENATIQKEIESIWEESED